MYADTIFPMLCYSHLTKNLKEDVDKAFDDIDTRKVISAVVGRTFALTTIGEIKEHIKLVIILLGAPKKTIEYVSIV